jgi:hypothetical protein
LFKIPQAGRFRVFDRLFTSIVVPPRCHDILF